MASRVFFRGLALLAAVLLLFSPARAQQEGLGDIFESAVRVVKPDVLMAGDTPVHLWGVEAVSAEPLLTLKARTALANAIGNRTVQCEVKSRGAQALEAQCVNKDDLDLGLFMLQEGYVTADRAAVYGSVFGEAYISAETQAQDRNLGLWRTSGAERENGEGQSASLVMGLGFALFLCMIGAFSFLTIVIMRGFRHVIEAQNDNLEALRRERKLRDRERGIIAAMIEAELKANKSKIEAYLAVYEEMLSSLKSAGNAPRYRKTGDLIQKQPLLARSVFDRNTDKLDMLGAELAGALIRFYAQIRPDPDYMNIEPDMSLQEVSDILENLLAQSRSLNDMADGLIDSFGKAGADLDMDGAS